MPRSEAITAPWISVAGRSIPVADIFLPIDRSDRRVLDDARKHDGIRDDDALARRGPQGRQADANLFDATFRCANTNMVSNPEGSLDENVDPVDESAADILKGETDTEGGGAEDGGDGGPTGANDRQDHGCRRWHRRRAVARLSRVATSA